MKIFDEQIKNAINYLVDYMMIVHRKMRSKSTSEN